MADSKNFSNFSNLIKPLDENDFFENYYDKKHLHLKSDNINKFEGLFTWESFSSILNMSSIWSSSSLKLVLDKKSIDPEKYCIPSIDREKNEVYQPHPEMVKNFLNKGATLIANDIDTLNTNVSVVANALEEKFSSKTQCNLYFSKQSRQGFDVHFDVHEVFAINLIGDKVWNLYDGRVENPINSDAYNDLDNNYAKDNCGKIIEQVLMKPGDILYIPRGQFHEALASSDHSMHLSFSITHIIGHDVLSILFNEAINEPFFRSNFPMGFEGVDKMKNWLTNFGRNLNTIIDSNTFFDIIKNQSDNYKFNRGNYNFPQDIKISNTQKYKLVDGIKIRKVNDKSILEINKKGIKIPENYVEAISKMKTMKSFTVDELCKIFSSLSEETLTKLIEDLSNMKIILKI